MEYIKPIDFDSYNHFDDTQNKGFAFSNIFNYNFIYNKDDNFFYFAKMNVDLNMKNIKNANVRNFLISPEVKKYLNTHTDEKLLNYMTYNKRNHCLFISPKLFALALLYTNKTLFCEYVYYSYNNKYYTDDIINFNDTFITDFNEKISYSKYFNIEIFYHNETNFIALQNFYDKYCLKYNINNTDNGIRKISKSHKLNTSYIQDMIRYLEFKKIGLPAQLIELTKDICEKYWYKTNFNGNNTYFIHQKLLFPFLLSLSVEKFLLFLHDNYDKNCNSSELVSMNIFKDIKIDHINENFDIIYANEIPLLLNIHTKYVNANIIAELLNSNKSNNTQRFFEKIETKKYIKFLLEKFGETPYCKESATPKKMQEMQKLENYFNDNISNEIINRLLNKYSTITKDNISIWKKIYSGGYYISLELSILFVIWINPVSAMNYIKFIKEHTIININDKILLKERNKLLESIKLLENESNMLNETYSELIFNISSKNTSLSIQNEELEKVIKGLRNTPIAHNKGDIKFRYLEENIFSAYARNYKLPLENKTKDFCFTSYYSKELLIIFSKYIKQFPQEYVEIINKNKFKISNIEKVKKLLNDLLTGNVIVDEKNWCLYDEIEKHKQLSNINNKNGKLLEDYVALIDTNNILWECLSIVWKSNFGLPDQDIGVDLVNIKEKKIFQCKNYINSKLRLSDLSTTLRTYDIIREFDSEYKLVLVVNENTIIDDLIPSSFEILRIDSDFIDIFE